MKTEIIKAIFTNVLFVMGVGFAIFGFINGTRTLTRSVMFNTYPLDSWEETRCDIEMGYPAKDIGETGGVTELSEEERESRRASCQASVESRRRVKQTEDIVSSVSTLVVGIVLILSFRQFIYTKPGL